MKLSILNTVIIAGFMSSAAMAQSPTTSWNSDVVENYLNPKKGATVNALTDLENNSRWYGTYRVKSGLSVEDQTDRGFLQLNARLRGKTMLNETTGIIGDFWLRAQENYVRVDGQTINKFDDIDDVVKWEQLRFGLEHDTLGALMFGNHTATWTMFTVDMGSQGLLDTQADAAQKNYGKILYKNHLDNNLFMAASYDLESDIYGVDLGYQTIDIYGFAPNAFGVYASVHNGQPTVFLGSKPIVGNVDFAGDPDNSDSFAPRADTSLFTYSVSGFKNFNLDYRAVGQVAYSPMSDGETADSILAKGGLTDGGLGLSATAAIQKLPQGFSGLSPILYMTYDEFGSSITPQLSYWFGSPNLRAWVSYSYHENAEDITRLEMQWDF